MHFQMKRGNNVFLGNNRASNLATVGNNRIATRQAWTEQSADNTPTHTKPSRAASLRVKGTCLHGCCMAY